MIGGRPRLDAAPLPVGPPAWVLPPTALRGPVFLTATCTLAVLAHVAGGGAVPDVAHLLLAGLVSALGWAPASDRRHGPAEAVARVGAVQVALHLVLARTPDDGLRAAAGHSHGAVHSWMSGALPQALMWAAHALAAALLALWLLRGERAAWAALGRAALLLVDRPAPWRPVTAAPARFPRSAPRRYRRPALPALGLRAPPLSA